MSTLRSCNKCKVVKDLLCFEKAKRYKEGRMPVCMDCRALYRAWIKTKPKRDPGATKKCSTCASFLPSEEFNKDVRSPDGRRPRCKGCARKLKQKEDPSVNRNRFMRWKYGIGLRAYCDMLLAQDGECAVCKGPPDHGRKRFDIDHDHRTGKVRGLLCSTCNRSLGLLKEDPVRMLRLAEYARNGGFLPDALEADA